MAVNGVARPVPAERMNRMIDGINGGGGPIRNPFTGRTSGPQAADAKEPARLVARLNPVARGGPGGLVAELASAPPVNRARVAELKAAIAGGRYPIDPQAIADAMIRLERGKP
ncbi:flagellar biosynthesis anti-sigma factor FlgM [Sandarakinorhabdus cyanobacteriorum]|uniref:Negative regulator of flagellin synthesis n=2 Tax=Sandarakinorhabdus cyanobacteriorum TaxID=1981098 RepID=A0A255Y9I2_9SPHN|nr:flagellar biosynthesis anti-sigma factor FlgM [Sandarakinorhabdus cyanobacteriorum]